MKFEEAIRKYTAYQDKKALMDAVIQLLSPFRGGDQLPEKTVLKENGQIVSAESIEAFIQWLSEEREFVKEHLEQFSNINVIEEYPFD